jgi:hypothetical protein
VNTADVWVKSLDYGGYGWVQATATIGGQIYPAIVQQTNWIAAPIPIDVNQNYLPDTWEQGMGIPLQPVLDRCEPIFRAIRNPANTVACRGEVEKMSRRFARATATRQASHPRTPVSAALI